MKETEPEKGKIVELKKALMMAPALGLPDLTKPFELFVHEKQHLALGVLARLDPRSDQQDTSLNNLTM